MGTDLELLDLHVRALFTHDARSRLLRVNEPGSEAPAPRLFFGRTRDGNLWRFRDDLPEGLVAELESTCVGEPAGDELHGAPACAEALIRLLETHAPVRKAWAGPAYYFTRYCEPMRPLVTVTGADVGVLRGGFEELIPELPCAQPFLAVLEGGRAVSVCRSVRVTPRAHEAGVETLPEFRNRGYAKEAVTGWAQAVRSAGAIPLYSTSWENAASQAVARKLRLKAYAADFHLT